MQQYSNTSLWGYNGAEVQWCSAGMQLGVTANSTATATIKTNANTEGHTEASMNAHTAERREPLTIANDSSYVIAM